MGPTIGSIEDVARELYENGRILQWVKYGLRDYGSMVSMLNDLVAGRVRYQNNGLDERVFICKFVTVVGVEVDILFDATIPDGHMEIESRRQNVKR